MHIVIMRMLQTGYEYPVAKGFPDYESALKWAEPRQALHDKADKSRHITYVVASVGYEHDC